MTRCETILWTRLQHHRLMGLHFRKQHPVGPYIADFACVKARLLVEVDGETHWREEERRRDARRTAFLEREGWTVLRVWNDEVYRNEQGVVETIGDWAMNGITARRAIRPPASGRQPLPSR
jgi:very-short-patch-repair endonuclease